MKTSHRLTHVFVFGVAGLCLLDSMNVAAADQSNEYVIFSINVQDFTHPDESVATLRRIAKIHQQHQVPVDMYLTTTMIDVIESKAPDLLDLARNSNLVSFAYHVRPPSPHYTKFDWLGLRQMTPEDQHAAILRYETRGLDLATGKTTDKAGGYQKLKDLLGHAPAVVSAQSDAELGRIANSVFKELGARMFAVHGRPPNFGERRDGVPLRPELVDLKLFQHPGEDPVMLIEGAFATAHQIPGAKAPYFIGVKMHDNDFIAERSAWLNAFMDRNRRPPWDISHPAAMKSEVDRAVQWKLYEDTVSYVASQRPRLRAQSATGVLAMLVQKDGQSASNSNQPTVAEAKPALSSLLYVSGTMHIESKRMTWPDPDALIKFFERATAAGRVEGQTRGMRWSIGADIDWLDHEPRAAEVIVATEKIGVQWDVHAHKINDRATCAALTKAYGGHPTSVASGLIIHEIESMRSPVIGRNGASWQAEIIWGLVKFGRHGLDSDDFAIGCWRPKSNDEFSTHDPNGNLIAVGGSRLGLAEVENLAQEILTKPNGPPVLQATVMVTPRTLTFHGTDDGIDVIEPWAARLSAMPSVRWATIEETAHAWLASGGQSSRMSVTPKADLVQPPNVRRPPFNNRPLPKGQ